MILIPVIALIIGFLLGRLLMAPAQGVLGMYMAVLVLIGLDSVMGGLRSVIEERFRTEIFVTGLLLNSLVALFFVWLGFSIGINLVLAIALFTAWRIFTNVGLIRRYAIGRLDAARQKKRLQAE